MLRDIYCTISIFCKWTLFPVLKRGGWSIFLLFFLWLSNNETKAQASLIDSLRSELANADKDTTRILLMKEIALNLYNINQDSALHILDAAFPLAENIKYNIGLYELWHTKGRIYEELKQLDSSIYFFEKANEIALEMDDKKRQAQSLLIVGKTFNSLHKKRLAIDYLNESLALSILIGDKDLQFDAFNNLGRAYSHLTIYDTSEIYYTRALMLQKELGNIRYQAGILRNLGNNAARSNNLEKALNYYEEGLMLMQETKDKGGEAIFYQMMGYSCFVMGYLPQSLEYYQTAMTIHQEAKNWRAVADCCDALSEVYLSMEDDEQALYYIEKSFTFWEKSGTKILKSHLLFRKGKVYMLKEDYETALQYLNQSLFWVKKENQAIESANHYFNLGTCYEKLNRQDSALVFFQEALIVSRESNELFIKSMTLKNLGSIHFKQGNTDQAIAELDEALKVATDSGNKELEMEASEVLYRIYKSLNFNDQALNYLETTRSLQDSLFNEKNVKKIARLEADYQFEQEKQQIAFERKQEIQEQQKFQHILYTILAVAILFIVAAVWYNRSKQRANEHLSKLNEELKEQKTVIEAQKEKLEELDEAKSRFFTNISHEFRTPLTIISGMIEQIKAKPDVWLDKGTQMIKQNSDNLLHLVNQILNLRKLESQNMEVNLVQGDVFQYLRYITESYQSYAQNKGIQLHFLAAQSSIQMDYDSDKLLRIISNLLSNAIKFTPYDGNIYFHIDQKSEKDGQWLQIRIEDTGDGIPKDRLANIFDRFYQVDDSSTRKGEGTGIGLALTRELVKLLNGKIEVQSEIGKGTIFFVKLPITTNSIIKDEASTLLEKDETIMPPTVFAGEPPSKTTAATEVLLPFESESSLPNLLIVEDNPDVIQFLVACLEDEYQLHIARNGQEGIDEAIEQIPDLIVSDVMMPEKDGFELCDTLKQDERTSHIPIILLTAKADLDSRISGLERGADAYLTKPFEQKELLIRLKKLLELRKRLQERYKTFDFKPFEEENPTSREDAFLIKVQKLIEENISDDNFGNVQLAKKMNLSESQLYRKIKALTDKSPVPFIRSVRLYKGKELLQSTEMNVSEVAYEVGFTDPAYFSRVFSKEFNISPNAIRK